jgi:hypothetical protein
MSSASRRAGHGEPLLFLGEAVRGEVGGEVSGEIAT